MRIKRTMIGNDFNAKPYYLAIADAKEVTTERRTFRPFAIGEEFEMGVVTDCRETHRIGAKWTVTVKAVANDVKVFGTYAEAKAAR